MAAPLRLALGAAGIYPGPRATPTYHQGRLYFAGPNGLIGCIDAVKGRPLWRVNVNEQFGNSGTEFGYSCSPTVVDGKVVLPVGGPGASLVALDADDGSLVWKTGDDAASYTPAYPITFQGQHLILGYLENRLVCHDLLTGKILWRHELSHGYDEHSAWPIYAEPHLWISGPFQGGSKLFELTGDPGEPLRAVWENDLMSNDIFSSVLVDGALYGFDLHEAQAKAHRPSRGQFRCIDFLTGALHWSTGSPKRRRNIESSKADIGQRIGHATVLAADGKLFLLNDTGELILARATKKKYDELARVSVLGGQICWTAPSISRGRLFVRNQARAVCLYVGDPQSLAMQTREHAMTVADIPQSKYIDLAAMILGVEPEYTLDIPSIEWLREWFYISFGILGISLLFSLAARLVLGSRMSSASILWLFWATTFVIGAAGTTVFSRWKGDFVFTWPVCIFVAFAAAANEVRLGARRHECSPARWRARLVAATFILCCVVYFLLCRRLSLVFESVFLCGFAAATPFSLAATHCFRGRRWQFVWHCLMTTAAFASFYWSAVAVLWLHGS